jgi:2-C-methyl-D-erythritol 4-phosphate cytidylyltransferase
MSAPPSTWGAVIVAAGRGERFGRPKQLLDVAGLPLAGWSIHTFAGMAEISELIVVTEAPWIDAMAELLARLAPEIDTRVVLGGATRRESAFNGVRAMTPRCDAILIHDGARPLVRAGDVRAAMQEVRVGRGALLAGRVVDTVKVVDPHSRIVVETLDRDRLWAAQTPQMATAADLRRAHELAAREAAAATDDAVLLERAGVEVVVVPASGENFKVTLPADIVRAEALLRERSAVEASR